MAGRYFGQPLEFLTQLRDKRQLQLLELDGKSSSIAAAGYSKSTQGFSIEELTRDLNEINFEISRQTGTERATCSYADFSYATER